MNGMRGGTSSESRLTDTDLCEPGDLPDHLTAVLHFKAHKRFVQIQCARVREPLDCPSILGKSHESEKIRLENMRPAREKPHPLACQSFCIHRESPRPACASPLFLIGLPRQHAGQFEIGAVARCNAAVRLSEFAPACAAREANPTFVGKIVNG